MDPRDGLPPFVNGVECAVCGRTVPLEGIRVLARREDLTFVELDCSACSSESLGIVVATAPPDGAAPEPGYGEFLAADADRFREALPIDGDDVRQVREILARHGIRALVGGSDDPHRGGSPR